MIIDTSDYLICAENWLNFPKKKRKPIKFSCSVKEKGNSIDLVKINV